MPAETVDHPKATQRNVSPDLLDAEQRLARLVTEARSVRCLLETLVTFGDIDDAYWHDCIRVFLDPAVEHLIDALGGVQLRVDGRGVVQS